MQAIITGTQSARWIGVITATLLPFCSIAQTPQTPAPSYADDSPAYSLAERGPDHCVWQKVSVAGTNQAGQTIYRTNQYTELGSGISAWRNGQWVAASPDVEITANGAQATNAIHQLFLPATVASGGIDLLMPDAQHLVTQLSGLSYFDPESGTNLWIGLLQDAQGYLLPTNNRVLYQNVFNGGFRVDAIYENNLAGGEQNLILREQIPPPSAWGLSDDSCRLLAWTEILSGPEMRVDEQQLDDGTVVAKLIYFGQMFIGPGKAFLTDSDLSSTNRPILVDKQVVRSGARTFLVESLKYVDVASKLATLPLPAGTNVQAQQELRPTGAGTNQQAGLRPVLFASGKAQVLEPKGTTPPHPSPPLRGGEGEEGGLLMAYGELRPPILDAHSAREPNSIYAYPHPGPLPRGALHNNS